MSRYLDTVLVCNMCDFRVLQKTELRVNRDGDCVLVQPPKPEFWTGMLGTFALCPLCAARPADTKERET